MYLRIKFPKKYYQILIKVSSFHLGWQT